MRGKGPRKPDSLSITVGCIAGDLPTNDLFILNAFRPSGRSMHAPMSGQIQIQSDSADA